MATRVDRKIIVFLLFSGFFYSVFTEVIAAESAITSSLGLAIATNDVERVRTLLAEKTPELLRLEMPFKKAKKGYVFHGSAQKFAQKMVRKLEKHIEKHPDDTKTYKLTDRLARAKEIVSLVNQATQKSAQPK